MNIKADAFMHQQFSAEDHRLNWTVAAVSVNTAVPSRNEVLCCALPEYYRRQDYFFATYWLSYCESVDKQLYHAENHFVFPKAFPYRLMLPGKKKKKRVSPLQEILKYVLNLKIKFLLI